MRQGGDIFFNALWSVVMMTDCAASGTAPRRAAASATISKAALVVSYGRVSEPTTLLEVGARTHHSVPTMRMPGSASFRNSTQARASRTAAELESAPRLVPCVCRGIRGVHDEEEKGEPEGEREGDWGADYAEAGVVYEIDVERDVDGRDNDEHVCGRIHDPFWHDFQVQCSSTTCGELVRTLALQVFLRHSKPIYPGAASSNTRRYCCVPRLSCSS
jgi:hypothetical protein